MAARKSVVCFGDGSYDLYIFLDDNPHKHSFFHEWVLPGGEHYEIYRCVSQGWYLGLFALGIAAAVLAVLFPARGKRIYAMPVPWIAMFGLLLFLIMWETNSRYTLDFMPVLFVCAGMGIEALVAQLPPHRKAVRMKAGK